MRGSIYLYILQNEEFQFHAIRPSIFIRDKHILSSERVLHKGYYHKCSLEKYILAVSLKGLGIKTDWR
jgi:hypothetical protein